MKVPGRVSRSTELMAPDRTGESRARQPDEFVAVGRVVRPHGVRGILLVTAISPLLDSLREGSTVWLGGGQFQSKVSYIRPHRQRYLLALEGLTDREQAEVWREAEVSIGTDAGAELPEGSYFYWQVIGLEVETESGESLGEIASIIETGANDVYVVRDDTGTELLLPAIGEVVRNVDLERGVMIVRLLDGLRP